MAEDAKPEPLPNAPKRSESDDKQKDAANLMRQIKAAVESVWSEIEGDPAEPQKLLSGLLDKLREYEESVRLLEPKDTSLIVEYVTHLKSITNLRLTVYKLIEDAKKKPFQERLDAAEYDNEQVFSRWDKMQEEAIKCLQTRDRLTGLFTESVLVGESYLNRYAKRDQPAD